MKSVPMPVDELFASLPAPIAGARLLVAFSGGMDSSVLLRLLHRFHASNLLAVHVHHGLQAAADDWAAHCTQVCQSLEIELRVCRVCVESNGQGLEAAARAARYGALRAEMNTGDVLVTAHHRDDQAETVLLQLLRGTGLRGLSGMRELSTFAPGHLWRPLLRTPRSELRAYAERKGLRWIDDPHNIAPEFSRSFLRQEIVPRLHAKWPAAAAQIVRAAELAAQASELLDEVGTSDLATLRDPKEGSLPIAQLRLLSRPRRHNLLRAWIENLNLAVPHRDTLERIDDEVLDARLDAEPLVAWPGVEVRRYRNRLFAMSPLPPLPPQEFSVEWGGLEDLVLPPGCGHLQGSTLRPTSGQVRLVREGERFRPSDSARTRRLRNLFQERSVPSWVRPRTPVLERDGQAIWIGGIGGSAHVSAQEILAPPVWISDLAGVVQR